ncbi:MAG: DUF2721 domain-containing protein [Elusimicrobia bacterium]|nr:DUF2721 domain-containing protein [Elusimicrobiota bacterium]
MLTAIGTMINAVNARLGRAVDRRRRLEERLFGLPEAEADKARAEIEQIGRRIHLVYLSILSAVASALFICLLIAGAFFGAFLAADLSRLVAVLFVLGVLSLVLSLLFFLREIFLAVSTPRHVPSQGTAS